MTPPQRPEWLWTVREDKWSLDADASLREYIEHLEACVGDIEDLNKHNIRFYSHLVKQLEARIAELEAENQKEHEWVLHYQQAINVEQAHSAELEAREKNHRVEYQALMHELSEATARIAELEARP